MDIVKRLRAKPPKGFVTSPLMIEAADEIERLREDKEEILEMLKKAHIWHEKLSALASTCVVDIERLQQRDGFIAKLDKQIVERDDEIERLREALREIAAPSKVFAKGNDMADVLVLVLLLTSHRKTALKALGEKE